MVKLDEVTNETYFPRGGGSEKPKKEKKLDKNGFPSKKGLKRKAGASKENETKKTKASHSWLSKVEANGFIEGLLGLGVVADIFDDGLFLHTSATQGVKIHASEMSTTFAEMLNAEEITMRDAFRIGQAVPFKVLSKKVKGDKGQIRATCNPAKLNKHLSPNMIVAGLVIHSFVTSIEEKGAILDIGLDQMTGFVEKDQQPSGGLKKGQPLLVRVLSSTSSRVVKVSSFVEQDNLNMTSCEKLQLNHLMPGTILECEPTGDDPVSNGVFVTIGNGLKGMLPRRNLPPRLQEKPENFTKTIRAAVMFCQQNSNVLVLNAHPDIVAISKIEKRLNFDGYSIGDKVKCTVMDTIPSKCIVSFVLPAIDGKKSLITAFCSKGFLESPDKIDTLYKPGQEKLCRVVGFRYVHRSLLVSTRKDVIQQKITSYKEAQCGEIVEGKILHISKFGINLTVCSFVKAFAPIALLSDKPLPAKLKTKFPIGSTVKCKVWEINEDRKTLIVACDPRIIAVKSPHANSVEQLEIGKPFPCVVRKVFPSGVLLLRTFNNIVGVMRNEYSKQLGGVKVTDFVEANVESFGEDGRVVFVPTTGSISTTAKEANKKTDKKFVQKPKQVDESIEIGKIYQGILEAKKGEKANVTFTGKDEKEVFASVEDSMLSDLFDAPIGTIKRILVEEKQEISRILALGKVSAINRASVKRFAAEWAKDKQVPKSFEDLDEGDRVFGVVAQIGSDIGAFVEIAGGSGLVGRIHDRKAADKNAVEIFELGQFVIGKVLKLDKEKNIFEIDPIVDLDNSEFILETFALPMLRNIVEEVQWLAEHSKFPIPGELVKAKVTKELEDLTLVEFENRGKKTAGVVHGKVENVDKKKKKKKLVELVVVDVNYSTNEIVLAVKEENPKIVAIRRDYLCAVDSEGLVYLPTRLHPNHVPSLETSAKIGDRVDFSNVENVGNVRIATRKSGDVDDEARAARIIVDFVGEKKKKVVKEEIKKEASNKGDSIKNFGTFEATVVGQFPVAVNQKNGLFAKLELPGGNIGRLHVSELPGKLIKGSETPMELFLKRNLNKKVYIRVISISKQDKIKIADVTMIQSKIQASKVRAKEMSYRNDFKVGDLVTCFGAASLNEASDSEIKVEINGLWSGSIPRENVSDDLKASAEDGKLVDWSIKKGEKREAKVVEVSRKQFKLVLSLKKDEPIKKQEFVAGAPATGRVFKADSSAVHLKLSTGQQALLTPTAISSKYESFEEAIKKRFSAGQLVEVICARISQSPTRYYVTLKKRYAEATECKDPMRKLILDEKEVEKGFECDGIVVNVAKRSLFVEIAPGISGIVIVREENEELLELGANSVVRVEVESVTKKGITFNLKEILIRKWAVKADRKRQNEGGDDIPKKVALIEENGKKEKVVVEDPGFDWSNKGFRNEDLAAVGKLTTKKDEEEEEISDEEGDDEISDEEGDDENDEEEEVEEEEEDGEDEEESEEDEEIETKPKKQKKEKPSVSEGIEESEEELSKLLRSDPNSAILWIKYMSLFLEKSDLAAARATAERAIETINYRESGELQNMWTAYLNMEVAFGDASTIQKVFERSCNNADSFTMHSQLAQIYQNSQKNQEAKQILETMVRKFRAQHVEVWTLLGEYLMKEKEHKAARELLQRALTSAQKQNHTQLISKFAQLEYKYGDSERGTTLFEGLITAHPKKNDLWLVYADALLKHSGIEQARKVLERACNSGNSLHKMRPLYKKWLEVENKHGDAASIELVKSKAEKYLQSVAENVLED